MNGNHEQVIAKVRKLLALSKSPNEHEASLAMEKAHALLAEHNLSMAEISVEEKQTAAVESQKFEAKFAKYNEVWIWNILYHTARLYFCHYFRNEVLSINGSRRTHHIFTGKPHNIVVAQSMAEYLLETVNRLAYEECKNVPEAERRTFRSWFRRGATQRLGDRLKKRLEETLQSTTKTEAGTNLPALQSLYASEAKDIKDFYAKSNMQFTTAKSRRSTINNPQGYEAGVKAGNEISLDAQIKGNGRTPTHLLK